MLNLLTAIALSAAQQSALDRVGPLSEIYQSYNDCFAATANGKLNPEALVELGWGRATSNGAESQSPMIFGRGDRAPLLMLNGDEESGICVVMAGFEDMAAVRKFLSAWGDKLPGFKDGQIFFFAEGHPIIIRQGGSQKKPRLNLIVGTASGTKE